MDDAASFTTLLLQLERHPQHDPHDDLIRQMVRLRARDACEYCLHPTIGQFHIDYVIPLARWLDYQVGRLPHLQTQPAPRRGPDHLDNFAWCCPFCNGSKRERIDAMLDVETVRLFHPRIDHWPEHFTFLNHYLFIVGITSIGIATQRVLNFNEGGIGGPLGSRHESIIRGRYPPHWLALP